MIMGSASTAAVRAHTPALPRLATPVVKEMPPPPSTISPAMAQWMAALQAKQAFKLIAGGSLTEAALVARCAAIYATAGVPCIDMAPELAVVEAVVEALSPLPSQRQPLLMVSLPLDPDPHFRKIELDAPDCIACGACVPLCPTEALELAPLDHGAPLAIEQPLCYGCGRCVPVCPTDALSLLPLHPEPAATLTVLNHPAVEAVEIHSHHADAALLPEFLATYGNALVGKAIAVCFQPDAVPTERWLGFVAAWHRWTQANSPVPLVLQIDGNPMSGTPDAEAPLPAIHAATRVYEVLKENFPTFDGFITLSGGMNAHAGPTLAAHPAQAFVAGIGVGTMARKPVWAWLHGAYDTPISSDAITVAEQLIRTFTQRAPQN